MADEQGMTVTGEVDRLEGDERFYAVVYFPECDEPLPLPVKHFEGWEFEAGDVIEITAKRKPRK